MKDWFISWLFEIEKKWVEETKRSIEAALDRVVKACRRAREYSAFLEGESLSLDLSPFVVEGWTIDISWSWEGDWEEGKMKNGIPYLVKRNPLRNKKFLSGMSWGLSPYAKWLRENYGFWRGQMLEMACTEGIRELYPYDISLLVEILIIVNKDTTERIEPLLLALEGFAKEIQRLDRRARRRAKKALRSPEAKEVHRRLLEKDIEAFCL